MGEGGIEGLFLVLEFAAVVDVVADGGWLHLSPARAASDAPAQSAGASAFLSGPFLPAVGVGPLFAQGSGGVEEKLWDAARTMTGPGLRDQERRPGPAYQPCRRRRSRAGKGVWHRTRPRRTPTAAGGGWTSATSTAGTRHASRPPHRHFAGGRAVSRSRLPVPPCTAGPRGTAPAAPQSRRRL
jgi:hypothetical protein